MSISPDSSSYINAAKNLAQTGRLVVFVNSPSQDMLPKVEPYTEPPPGVPAYFVPYMLVFDDPVRAAVVAQAMVIAWLFTFLYLLMGRLGLSRPLRAIALGILLMIDGFKYIYIDPGTEALFICLSVIIGWLAIRYYQGGHDRWVWPILVLLIAFASSVRYRGVANVAWLIPALFRRRIIAGIPQLLTHRYVVIVIMGGGFALVTLSLLADALGLGPSRNPGFGPVEAWGIALGLVTFVNGMILLVIGRRLKLHSGPERSDSALAPDVYWPIGAGFPAWRVWGLMAVAIPVLIGFGVVRVRPRENAMGYLVGLAGLVALLFPLGMFYIAGYTPGYGLGFLEDSFDRAMFPAVALLFWAGVTLALAKSGDRSRDKAEYFSVAVPRR